MHGLRPVNDDAHLKDGFCVFRYDPTDSKHPLSHDPANAVVALPGIGMDAVIMTELRYLACLPA